MKLIAAALIGGMFAGGPLARASESACAPPAVKSHVEAAPGKLTLADLLAPGACRPLRLVAERVGMGAAPSKGSVRVLDGRDIDSRLAALAKETGVEVARVAKGTTLAPARVPERIVIRQAGAVKSCAEVAGFLNASDSAREIAGDPMRWRDQIDCAALPVISEDTALELVKTSRNQALRRWEFGLRCARPEACVPFLLWARERKIPVAPGEWNGAGLSREKSDSARLGTGSRLRLVAPGQTATLTWDERGIRIVLPVTCLDGGALGEFVRVRFKNAPRILRAEVMADGMLRAAL